MSEDLLTSVGIDVGTTTTQVILSRLRVASTGPGSAGKLAITDRKILFRGEIHETPLIDAETIDAAGVAAIVEEELERAGVSRAEIDTGAVIVTGETARRSNAAALVSELALELGEFVVETAGAHLEAVLAGRGSGAAAYANRENATVANIDVGGGTTNIAIFDGDAVRETRCCRIGGRLVEVDDGTVQGVAETLRPLLDHLDMTLAVGDDLTAEKLDRLGESMADCLADLLTGPPYPDPLAELAIGELPDERVDLDVVAFTGGVGSLVSTPTDGTVNRSAYGDIGVALARAIRDHDRLSDWPRLEPSEDIRATVVGTGTATTRLSGRTVGLNAQVLPLRNVPVLSVPLLPAADTVRRRAGNEDGPPGESNALSEEIRDYVEQGIAFYGDDADPGAAEKASEEWFFLAFEDIGELTYDRIEALAEGIVTAYDNAPYTGPILLLLAQNCGKALAQSIRRGQESSRPVVVLDELSVEQGTYIDVGEPISDDDTVPVVVKTLVFEE
ncbi:ethanolamine ammonia-lyase reactivating factor EutA [Halobium salinum]|uniref:Ethanolamine ammonia-lyase reactivating factor EutA n=1 Tax=Halobium salinum TaxID=1364940 RepID=A0ABD5P9W2_9EURY|nr:ethanolamine ammonia-lyase reactivating factor EutA [Halobium salinum]